MSGYFFFKHLKETEMAENRQDTGSSGGTSNRGFASMDDEKQREIARKGGESVPDEKRSFAQDPKLASEAGRKGGESSGGGASSGGRQGSQGEDEGGSRGGSGNFAQNPEKASEAGRKGGQH